MLYNADMNKKEIRERARAAGFPPPTFDDGKAIITIPMDMEIVPRGRVPEIESDAASMTASAFEKWAKAKFETDADTAGWINARLGTKYNNVAVYKWRADIRPVPARIAGLVKERGKE